MIQVLRLACHDKRAGDAPSAAPTTQNEPDMLQVLLQTSADLYEGAPNAAPATQNKPEMLQVLRLPRKTNEAAPKSITRHQTSANLYVKVLQVLCVPRKTAPSADGAV